MTGTQTARMPAALTKLQGAFLSFVSGIGDKSAFGAPDRMREVETKLRASIAPGSQLPATTICRSVKAFHAKSADRLSRRDIRALCAGLNHSCATCGGASVLQSAPENVFELFSRHKRAFKEKQLHLESWYDLVQSYLGAPERSVGCEMLRELLSETLSVTGTAISYPFHWLPVLLANRDILGKDPCRAAAEQALKGHAGDIEALRRQLGIPDSSWFWRELTAARAAQAVQLEDAGFIAVVPGLLQALHFLPNNLKDQVIRQFLERSVKCAAMPEELKNFTVEYWGQLGAGAHAKYELISQEARLMVQERIARDDVQDFMTLLQAKGADERKLAFWNRYIKSIEYHRILLGPDAQRTPQLDIAQLRRRPSVGKLAGGADSNNALLLKIGNWLVVESAGPENPLFGYRFAKLPFDLDGADVDLPCFRKAATADFKLLRQDTLEGQWEDKLAPELATLGIRRDDGVTAKRKAGAPAAPPTPAPEAKTSFDEEMFQTLIREARLQSEDMRKQGGALWVVGDMKDNYYLAQKLAAWDFKWKPGRGWWRT